MKIKKDSPEDGQTGLDETEQVQPNQQHQCDQWQVKKIPQMRLYDSLLQKKKRNIGIWLCFHWMVWCASAVILRGISNSSCFHQHFFIAILKFDWITGVSETRWFRRDALRKASRKEETRVLSALPPHSGSQYQTSFSPECSILLTQWKPTPELFFSQWIL